MLNNWTILAGSAIGNAHINAQTPCQDYCLVRTMGNGWGVAVVADGAGSCKNSHIGSHFTCWEIVCAIHDMAILKGWMLDNKLPSDHEWKTLSNHTFLHTRQKLQVLAQKECVLFNSLSSTVIVAIFSPLGICVAHIGDGRAGYKNHSGKWESMITPHTGTYANETVFLTSEWPHVMNKPGSLQIPESKVIREQPIAFCMMTDGCEIHSFNTSVKVKGKEKYSDPNTPHDAFFNPLIDDISRFNGNEKAMHKSWEEFLTNGTTGIASERDDKTMIIGFLNNEI